MQLQRAYNHMTAGDDCVALADWACAEREYGAARALEPAHAEMAFWYAVALATAGKLDAGAAALRAGVRRRPALARAREAAAGREPAAEGPGAPRRHPVHPLARRSAMLTLLALLLQAAQAAATLHPPATAASPRHVRADDRPARRAAPRDVGRARPDGTLVAYVVRETNWDDNAYETEIWLADAGSGERAAAHEREEVPDAPACSPDGKRLAFVSDRGDKRQVYLIDPSGGEAEALTTAEEGVTAFAWSPDGSAHRLHCADPKTEAMKEREKKYGEYEVVGQDHRMTHLHVIDVAVEEGAPAHRRRVRGRQLRLVARRHARSPSTTA